MITAGIRLLMRSAIVLGAVLSVTSVLHAAPKITFEERAVVVSGVTPGGLTAWIASAHEPYADHLRVSEDLTGRVDDDRDGIVRVEFDRPVPPRAMSRMM